MSGLSTRKRIITCALKLFNEHGIQNITLQQIADEAQISVGNLAYHFHDKEQILKRIEMQISEEMDQLLRSWKDLPAFIDFDNQLSKLYHLLGMYSFYFLDILELQRAYHGIHATQQKHIRSFIEQIKAWLQGCVRKEMIVSLEDDQVTKIAEMIWFISSFWMSRKRILAPQEFDEWAFREMVWQQLKPFMSKEGQFEFEAMVAPGLSS